MIPYFSIIIPLYNKETLFRSTLDSVWNQTFKDFEVIVVNDASTDASLDIAESINDERLNIFSIENKGVSHARNFGISKAKSDLIVFLDADDLWNDHHLEDLKVLNEKFPNCGLYCKAYSKQKGTLTINSRYKNISQDIIWEGVIENYFESSMINSIAWTSAVMIPKATFETIGYFNESYNSGEDTDLWIRIALKLPVAFSNKISAVHRLHSENSLTSLSLSSRNHVNFDAFEEQAKTNVSLKRYLDVNRYSLAIQYKLEGHMKLASIQYSKIKKENLSFLQILVYKLPKPMVSSVLNLRNLLRKLGVDLRLFR